MSCVKWSYIAFSTLRDKTDEKEDDDGLALSQGGRMLYGEFLVSKVFALIR